MPKANGSRSHGSNNSCKPLRQKSASPPPRLLAAPETGSRARRRSVCAVLVAPPSPTKDMNHEIGAISHQGYSSPNQLHSAAAGRTRRSPPSKSSKHKSGGGGEQKHSGGGGGGLAVKQQHSAAAEGRRRSIAVAEIMSAAAADVSVPYNSLQGSLSMAGALSSSTMLINQHTGTGPPDGGGGGSGGGQMELQVATSNNLRRLSNPSTKQEKGLNTSSTDVRGDHIVRSGHQEIQTLYAANNVNYPDSISINLVNAPDNSTVQCDCGHINCPLCNLMMNLELTDPSLLN